MMESPRHGNEYLLGVAHDAVGGMDQRDIGEQLTTTGPMAYLPLC